MMLGRVLATPTRLVRLPPETEVSNRVLRHFAQYKDRFIRVAFGEESSSKLFLASGRQHNADLKRRCAIAQSTLVGLEAIHGHGVTELS